jgi:hypothetical protein
MRFSRGWQEHQHFHRSKAPTLCETGWLERRSGAHAANDNKASIII